MFFVHLAREELVLACEGETTYIPYIDLERVLPAKIVHFVERFSPTQCCIINGPWGFTPLRIGTVIINLLQQYATTMSLYPLSKLDLYRHAVEQKFLPPVGILWIGQKKNMLLYNFLDNQRSLISAEQMPIVPTSYFVDRVVMHPLLDLTDPHAGVVRAFTKHEIELTYQGKTFSVDPQAVVASQAWVFPEYVLAPSIG
jgi:hypothetical protein